MKHCPSCSSELPRSDAAFCPECGKSLSRAKRADGKHTPKHAAPPVKRNLRKMKKAPPKRPREDLPYDGYYDDVLPSDGGEFRQGLDSKLVKQIILLLASVLVIVALCVVMLFLMRCQR